MKKIEILIRKYLLKIILFFNNAVKSSDKISLNKNSNVLLIRLNRIGDALVSTPFIKTLKKCSGSHLTILADKKNHFIFQNNPNIDEVIIFEKGLKGIIEIVKIINSKNFDVIVDMHDDPSTTVSFLISLFKSNIKVSLNKGNNEIYSHTIDRLPSETTHVVDRLMNLLNLFDINFDTTSHSIEYHCNDKNVKYCKEFIEKSYKKRKFLLGINISAGSDARFWGVERFALLIEELIQDFDLNILLISAKKDIHYAKEISNGKHPIFCEDDFDKFASIVNELDFLFTPDTSIIHLAAAFSVPLYGLYVKYNTEDIIWYPYKSEYKAFITTDPNFANVGYDLVTEDFFPYLEKFIPLTNHE